MLLFFLLASVSHEIGKTVTIDEGQESYSGMMNETHRHRGAPQVAVTTRRLVLFWYGITIFNRPSLATLTVRSSIPKHRYPKYREVGLE